MKKDNLFNIETLPTRYNFINCTLVPTVQSTFSRFDENDERELS